MKIESEILDAMIVEILNQSNKRIKQFKSLRRTAMLGMITFSITELVVMSHQTRDFNWIGAIMMLAALVGILAWRMIWQAAKIAVADEMTQAAKFLLDTEKLER